MAWAPLFAQAKFSVSTNKAMYQYGDSIHITITAVNTGNTTDTLVFPSTCQVNYYVDSFDFLQHRACGQIVTRAVIPPHDSINWSAPYLPPYPVTHDTLTIGNHAVLGEVIGYWISDTIWIKVSLETEVRETNQRDYFLEDNYPNPFNPSTTISYQLPATTLVTLKVYDVLGREVATLVNERQSPGTYSVIFIAANLPSGVYFYKLEAGTFSQTKKLTLLK